MIDFLDLIVCGTKGQSQAGSSAAKFSSIPHTLSAVSAEECSRHFLNTHAPFAALANASQSALTEPLGQAVSQLQADENLDVVLLFPPAHQDSCQAWQIFPNRLAALRENPAVRIAAVVFRSSRLKELGFADVSAPVWDGIIRASKKPGSCQAMRLVDEFAGDSPLESPSLPVLAPRHPDRSGNWLKSHLDAVSPEELVSRITSPADGVALKAGLLQIHDYLDASHELSQSVQGHGRHSAGDYWHAIMHRREPDYSNAKYWLRNVGAHPVFKKLATAVDSILAQTNSPAAETVRRKLLSGSGWDPFAFVDFCQECNRGGDSELTQIAKQIQWAEMQFLLEQTYEDAST